MAKKKNIAALLLFVVGWLGVAWAVMMTTIGYIEDNTPKTGDGPFFPMMPVFVVIGLLGAGVSYIAFNIRRAMLMPEQSEGTAGR